MIPNKAIETLNTHKLSVFIFKIFAERPSMYEPIILTVGLEHGINCAISMTNVILVGGKDVW